MEQPVCKDCTHFRQHFILDEQSCSAVSCGHCAYPRLKYRRPDEKVCPHFQAGAHPLPDRAKVVHYLTTEILDYVMGLALPPEQIK